MNLELINIDPIEEIELTIKIMIFSLLMNVYPIINLPKPKPENINISSYTDSLENRIDYLEKLNND